LRQTTNNLGTSGGRERVPDCLGAGGGEDHEVFFKKGFLKNKIRKRGADWEKFEKWVPPAR
jgi:hypothetical protein